MGKKTLTKPNKVLSISLDKFSGINLGSVAVGSIFIAIWIFWSFSYKYNLYFQEQLQLFLLTGDYFWNSISTPGGFSGYVGEFLTQFYFVPFLGASIILALLLLLQQLTIKLFQEYQLDKRFTVLSILPPVWYSFILTDEFYLLSGLVGVNIAIAFCLFYMTIRKDFVRAIVGLLFLPLVYFLTGGSYLLFLLVILLYEFVVKSGTRISFVGPVLFTTIAIAFPLLVKKYYFATPHLQAFISNHYYKISTEIPFPVLLVWIGLPLLLLLMHFTNKKRILPAIVSMILQMVLVVGVGVYGFRIFTSMSSEHTKAFDYYARQGKWEKIVQLADKQLPRNTFSVYYVNIALAKTGQLGEKMFAYKQVGKEGLFMPYNREHLSAMIGSEVFYHLGLVNASQLYMFESMEATPDLRKTVCGMKRLAETNIINGEYEVARKYLHKLKQTLFYRQWAKDAETYLYDEDRIARHPDWGEKRLNKPVQDYFFSIDHIDQILMALLYDRPNNKIAYEYLMAHFLITKNLKGFMSYLPHSRELHYKKLPQSYQEAFLYVLGLQSKNPERDRTYPIDDITKLRLHAYANIYTSSPKAEEILDKDFGETYWYYFHFRE